MPSRNIYCLDLRDFDSAEVYLEEIRRIDNESKVETVDLTQWIQGEPRPDQMQRYLQPDTNPQGDGARKFDDSATRRWYPVIDYDRCTNCMECIDFCLFGVYGVDGQERTCRQ